LYTGSTEPAHHPLPSTTASNGVQQDLLFRQLDDNLELGPEHLTSQQFRLHSESIQDMQLENIPSPRENWPSHSCPLTKSTLLFRPLLQMLRLLIS